MQHSTRIGVTTQTMSPAEQRRSYHAICETCGWYGREFNNKAAAMSDGDEHVRTAPTDEPE